DGKVTEVSSIWKRFQLSGFKGWVMIPKEAFTDPVPETGKQYKFVIMFEDAPTEGAKRTSDMKFSIGSIGYYTDYTGFMFEKAGEDAMSQAAIKQIGGYVDEIKALKPKTEREVLLKNKMLVHFSNLKENFNSLSSKEKIKTVKGLYDEFYGYMEDYLYGDIRKTELLMTFATMSDTHFTNTWVNERFLSALTDAKTLDPDLSAVFVLGDISNEGVSPSNPALTELDNYYNWLDSYQYKNSKGEDIPIRNVLGNHDYRGPSTEPGGKYPQGAYAPAVEMYLEREGVKTLQWDMWLNGYHFIFLNSDKYHTDDAYLSAQTIDWLDATLAENDNGQPAFVLIHQPLDRVHVMDGAKYTFAEVIARHSNAIVLSGHNHSDFGNTRIIDEGNGYFVNQPAMVNLSAQYYFVEVYEGGVIFRAREAATKSWHISSDVVVANFDRSNNVVASADSLSLSAITLNGVTAVKEKANSVSGKAVKLTAGANGGSAVIPAYASGNISNYEGFAIYAEGQNAFGVKVGGIGLKANATYYAVENGAMVEKTASDNGQIVANGWTMIPKTSFNGELVLSKATTLEAILSANQEISIDKISYYFVAEDFINEVTSPSCSFFDDDGSLISISSLAYGSEVVLPKNPTKQSTAAYDYEFAGWDLDGDGKVDELPSLLKGSFNAVAVYD
ncbi:MAG: metallophosphoesterase, partial [Clostridia bacterium]|nr:metallophosphoesterase [Clostridia bacterium]